MPARSNAKSGRVISDGCRSDSDCTPIFWRGQTRGPGHQAWQGAHGKERVIRPLLDGRLDLQVILPHDFDTDRFGTFSREIVVVRNRETGLELIGHHADPPTNVAHKTAESNEAAIIFAKRLDFPRHGLIVIGVAEGNPAPDRYLHKNALSFDDLTARVGEAIAICGAAHVETDMRAYRNPTRMRAIKGAAIDLVWRY